ncbi:MAG: hypothetical protein V3V13_06030, partial [Paracoccaceae bacterium]
SGPAGGPVPAEDDPTPTGSVGPAGGPIPPSPPHTPPYLDPDVSAPQPVLLDLDGDGIEVVFDCGGFCCFNLGVASSFGTGKEVVNQPSNTI